MDAHDTEPALYRYEYRDPDGRALYRYEYRDPDGRGERRVRVYPMTPASGGREFWAAVTDVLCPVCQSGRVRWAEAGYVPGYRICDGCGRHYLAAGDAEAPLLVRIVR
jgi:hypothetical protein